MRLRLLLLVCTVSVLPAPAVAQNLAAVLTSDATIAVPPVSGGGNRNLTLGTIAVGGSVDTGAGAEANTASAKWEFTGLQKNATVNMSFTLPTLTKNGVTLPIEWSNAGYGTWCARRAPEVVGTCGAAGTNTGTFNPAAAATASTTGTTNAGNNDRILTVWIGARVTTIPANQPPGTYTGTVTLLINVL